MKMSRGPKIHLERVENYSDGLSRSMEKFKEINRDGDDYANALEQLEKNLQEIDNDETLERGAKISALRDLREDALQLQRDYDERVEKPKKELEKQIEGYLSGIEEHQKQLDKTCSDLEKVRGEGKTEQIVNQGVRKAIEDIQKRKSSFEQVKEFNEVALEQQIANYRRSQIVTKGRYGSEEKF